MPYTCDTCGRMYANKRNLCRHIKEKHNDGLLHFKCVVPGCTSKFIRRGYLKKHLSIVHKMENPAAQQSASDAVLQPDQPKRAPLTETGRYETISDAEDAVKDANDGEFNQWLDDIIQSDTATQEANTVADSETAVIGETGEMSIKDLYDQANMELKRLRDTDAGSPDNDDGSDVMEDVSDDSTDGSMKDNVTDADNSVSNVDDVNAAVENSTHSDDGIYTPITSNDDVIIRSDSATEDDGTTINATDDSDDAAINATDDSDEAAINATDDRNEAADNITEQYEYINVTLRTTTRYINGVYDSVDRVVSLGYLDSFNPDYIDPLQVFRRVQEEFINYVTQHYQ